MQTVILLFALSPTPRFNFNHFHAFLLRAVRLTHWDEGILTIVQYFLESDDIQPKWAELTYEAQGANLNSAQSPKIFKDSLVLHLKNICWKHDLSQMFAASRNSDAAYRQKWWNTFKETLTSEYIDMPLLGADPLPWPTWWSLYEELKAPFERIMAKRLGTVGIFFSIYCAFLIILSIAAASEG